MRGNFPRLYVILDAALAGDAIFTLARELADAGVTLMQLRDKQASARRLFLHSQKLLEILRPRGARLIVNDRADVAAACGADGAHVGQDDIDVESARVACPPPMWIGVSTHNLEQVSAAAETSADYIALGPIFPTQTKANPDPVVGLAQLREARKMTEKPIVAIGGITAENAAEVFSAGADCVAVARNILSAANPAARAKMYQ